MRSIALHSQVGLLVVGAIATLISAHYFVVPPVGAAFFLIYAMTISRYRVMYLLLHVAAHRLRSSRLVGGGTPLFGALDSSIALEPTQVLVTSAATHIGYRVVK